MNIVLKLILRFAFYLLVQVLVLNQLELGLGTQMMIYPLFIILLPVEMNIFIVLGLAFGLGLSIDGLSDTYGLHASSLLVVAYVRPWIFKAFSPRDGYEQIEETSIQNMGFFWFLQTVGILLLIHHFWFFLLEMFKLNEILFILQKTVLSAILTFVICLLLQYLFVRKNSST